MYVDFSRFGQTPVCEVIPTEILLKVRIKRLTCCFDLGYFKGVCDDPYHHYVTVSGVLLLRLSLLGFHNGLTEKKGFVMPTKSFVSIGLGIKNILQQQQYV